MDIEPLHDLDEIFPILTSGKLEAADIDPATPPLFFGIRDASALLAVVGLEVFGTTGLLRSLAVVASSQGRGLARELVTFAEETAVEQGVNCLFLLTDSAAAFFLKMGYVHTVRAVAPPAIQATPQFSSLCPASSALMCKSLGRPRSCTLESALRKPASVATGAR
ncbi:MAG: GNAT family N-acetyltransferase [Pseudomonadota bacterium]|nr:GNAT family N-acetyltransferase [Pseudomonadota bacterium]